MSIRGRTLSSTVHMWLCHRRTRVVLRDRINSSFTLDRCDGMGGEGSAKSCEACSSRMIVG